jgi:hypothetical protein
MKIQSYPNDNSISLQDKVTGTDADDGQKTKNYTFQAIKDFFIAQGFGSSSSTAPAETGLPYKVYTALLSCTDSSTIILNVADNSIGNIVWARNSIGNYSATLDGAFVNNKTLGFTSINNGFVAISSLSIVGSDSVFVEVRSAVTGNNIDYIEKLAIEIRVYN